MPEGARPTRGPRADRAFPAVWIALSLLFLLPVILTEHLPIQDIPTHLAIIKTLGDRDSAPGWSEHFEDRLGVQPYVTYYAAGVTLARWFGAEAANRILLAVYVLLLPLSFLSLILAIDRSRRWSALFGFLLVYSDLYLLGFTNYILSLPMALFGSALATRLIRRPSGGFPLAGGLGALALLIYLTHPLSLALLVVILAALLPFVFNSLRRLLWPAAALSPALLLLFLWLLRHHAQSGIVHFPVVFKLEYLLRTPVMLLETPDNAVLYAVLGLAVALVGIAVAGWMGKGPMGRRIAALRPGRRTILPGFLAFTILYFASPFSVGATIWLDLRLAVIVWIFIFLAWGHHLTTGPTARVLTVSLCLAALLGIGRVHRDFSREIDPLFTVLEEAEPGRRILPILLDPISGVIEPFYFRDRVIPFCTPYAHFGSYYHLKKGGVSPWMTFSAGLDWVPLGLKDPLYVQSFRITDPFQPIRILRLLPEVAPEFDYLLVRGGDAAAFAWIERFAVRRAQSGAFHLFKVHPSEGRKKREDP